VNHRALPRGDFRCRARHSSSRACPDLRGLRDLAAAIEEFDANQAAWAGYVRRYSAPRADLTDLTALGAYAVWAAGAPGPLGPAAQAFGALTSTEQALLRLLTADRVRLP
jgi:hypothetical protein